MIFIQTGYSGNTFLGDDIVDTVTPITRFEDSPEYKAYLERWQEKEAAVGQDDPYFVCHDSPLTDTSLMAGQRVLNFGSYNYAGMSGRP